MLIHWTFRLVFASGASLPLQMGALAQEICTNGIDDDGDGLVDLNDAAECPCDPAMVDPVNLVVNGSFEDYSVCPFFPTQLDYSTGWTSVNWTTPEYVNTCGYTTQGAVDAGLLPFSDGEGAVGIIMSQTWKEYITSCLSVPLVAGTDYTFSFQIGSFPTIDSQTSTEFELGNNGNIYYGPLDVVLYGNTSCNTPMLQTDGCPTGVSPTWVVLGSVNYTPGMAWTQLTFDFVAPGAISAISLGAPCVLGADYGFGPGPDPCYPYFLLDDLQLFTQDNTTMPDVTISMSGDPCLGDAVLNTTVSPSDPATQTLQWYQNGIALVGEDALSYVVAPNASGLGDYQAVVFTNGTCAISDLVAIDAAPVQVAAVGATLCAGEVVNLSATGAESYVWSTGATTPSISVEPANTVVYTVIGTGTNCSDTTTVTVLVEPIPEVTISDDVLLTLDLDSIQLVATIDTGSFVWTPSTALSCTSCLDPFASPEITTEYCLTATLGRCSAEACMTVTVQLPIDPWDAIEEELIYVPNCFTPNGDGINDAWGPIASNWETMRVEVFDRWGGLVHVADEAGVSWNGAYSDGSPVQDGIYNYRVRVRFMNKAVRVLSGHVVLLR